MSKKQVTVTIKRTKRKEADQPWVVTIQPPGKAQPVTIKQRYADKRGAKRGALSLLNAVTRQDNPNVEPFDGRKSRYRGPYEWQTRKGVRIVFEYK